MAGPTIGRDAGRGRGRDRGRVRKEEEEGVAAGKGELNQGRESILSKAFATFSGANCVAAALKPGLPSINLFCQLPPSPATSFYATF